MFLNVIELNKKVWKGLLARRDRLPHALLLAGPKGIGKFELARQFAKGLLCEQAQGDGVGCGHCLACNWFEHGDHPDFRLLQPEALSDDGNEPEDGKKKASQQITVDQIRALDEFFTVGTHRGGLRIILIHPTESMNRNTANSLLKTLEEPSAGTLFLLVSNEPSKLLPTIRSRCQMIPIAAPPKDRAIEVMKASGISDPERWLAMAGGAPLLAIDFTNGGNSAWIDTFIKRLGGGGTNLSPLDLAAELEKVIKDSKGKIQLKHIVETMQKWIVDLTLARNGLPPRYFVSHENTITKLAAMIPATRLIQSYRSTITRRQESEQPLNARLFLEALLMDYRALFAN